MTLHIDPKGNSVVSFANMQPVTFNATGGTLAGSFVYSGQVTGALKLPPGDATSGNWNYVSIGDLGGLTAAGSARVTR